MLHAVPVTLDLRDTGVLGVVGRPADAGPLADWLLAQRRVWISFTTGQVFFER